MSELVLQNKKTVQSSIFKNFYKKHLKLIAQSYEQPKKSVSKLNMSDVYKSKPSRTGKTESSANKQSPLKDLIIRKSNGVPCSLLRTEPVAISRDILAPEVVPCLAPQHPPVSPALLVEGFAPLPPGPAGRPHGGCAFPGADIRIQDEPQVSSLNYIRQEHNHSHDLADHPRPQENHAHLCGCH